MKTRFTVLFLLLSFPFFAQLEFTKDMIEVEGSASYRYSDNIRFGNSQDNRTKTIQNSFDFDLGVGWHIRPGIVWGLRLSTIGTIQKVRGFGENESSTQEFSLEFFHRRYLNINNWQRVRFFSQFDFGGSYSIQNASNLINDSNISFKRMSPVELRAGLGIMVKITRRIAVYKYLFGASYLFSTQKRISRRNNRTVDEFTAVNHSIQYSSTQSLTQFSLVYFLNVDQQ